MTARRLPKFLAAVLAPSTLIAVACGSGSGSKLDSGIHIVPDSPGSGTPDAPGSGGCTASTSYSNPSFNGSNSGAINFQPGQLGSGAPHVEGFDGMLNADAMPDDLHIELWGMTGAFGTQDIKTGTFQLSGSDLDYATCGICVLVQTDIHMQGSGFAQTDDYMATGGSVTLTSVGTNGTGTLSGTLSNVQLTHVTIDPQSFESTPVGDCNTTISSASFSGTLMAGMFTAPPHPVTVTLHHRYQ